MDIQGRIKVAPGVVLIINVKRLKPAALTDYFNPWGLFLPLCLSITSAPELEAAINAEPHRDCIIWSSACQWISLISVSILLSFSHTAIYAIYETRKISRTWKSRQFEIVKHELSALQVLMNGRHNAECHMTRSFGARGRQKYIQNRLKFVYVKRKHWIKIEKTEKKNARGFYD